MQSAAVGKSDRNFGKMSSTNPRLDVIVAKSWTTDDYDQCVDLVIRARHRGALPDVMRRVHRIENGQQASFLASGLADGDYAMCDEISGLGAMTDAAKRNRSDDEEDDKTYCKVNREHGPSAHSYAPGSMPGGSPLKSTQLPLGINSLEEWGTFKVPFGKFKGKKTYYDIFSDNSDEMETYRNTYLLPRRESGSALLKDLVQYLDAMKYEQGNQQMPLIPGTNVRRSR